MWSAPWLKQQALFNTIYQIEIVVAPSCVLSYHGKLSGDTHIQSLKALLHKDKLCPIALLEHMAIKGPPTYYG